ncbi:DUF4442 domain-containing protein [Mycobacterium kubicae]|uniref:DUF4442 domain-containing protein n=1 Tax=Mycobacterium kubicae TaxID=120959 RepID=UPI002101B54A|nr:DUF4442 domain-containing protein [Mycobacterium kubicae]
MADPLVDMMNAGMATTIPTADKMGVRVLGRGAGLLPPASRPKATATISASSTPACNSPSPKCSAASSPWRHSTQQVLPAGQEPRIAFLGMATTALRAEASMDDETIARVEAEAAAKGKADYVLDAVVTDAAGTVVATTHGLYQLRAHRR